MRSSIAAGSFDDVASQREEAYILSQPVSTRPQFESEQMSRDYVHFFDQTGGLCEAARVGRLDADGVDSRKGIPTTCTHAGTAVV